MRSINGYSFRPMTMETAEEALACYNADPEAFEKPFDERELIADRFIEVKNKKREVVGFFALGYWNSKKDKCNVLCFAYVKEGYRRKGAFNAMVEWCKKHTAEGTRLEINAESANQDAIAIYRNKFIPLGRCNPDCPNTEFFVIKKGGAYHA